MPHGCWQGRNHMANQEQLDILKQGVEVWNQWRNQHPFLMRIDLSGANLTGANLNGADLSETNLRRVDFIGASLSKANLSYADLSGANLSGANLDVANFYGVRIGYTTFGDVDLRKVKGLETLEHLGPSTIGLDTIIRSHGNIPEIFLRKAGVPDAIIEQIPALIGSLKPID